MRDRWVPIDIVGAAPEEEIARLERIELKRIRMPAKDGIEISRLAHPNVLLAGVARHIGKSVLLENVINKTGAIHAAICGISGAVRVTKILFCQLEPSIDDLAHFRRISVIARDFVGRNRRVGRAFFFWSRVRGRPGDFSWTWRQRFLRRRRGGGRRTWTGRGRSFFALSLCFRRFAGRW